MTVMMIPASSAKIKKLSIPYWTFGLLAAPVLCIAAVIVLFQLRIVRLETRLDSAAASFADVSKANETLRGEIISLENDRLSAQPYIPPTYTIEDDNIPPVGTGDDTGDDTDEKAGNEAAIVAVPDMPDENSERLSELLLKADAIDNMKNGIIGVFKQLSDLDIPFQFDEDTLSGGVIKAAGGAYSGDIGQIIDEVEVMLSGDADELETLTALAEELEALFMSRPTGWPVDATEIGSGFGYRENPFTHENGEKHNGIDLTVPIGTEVRATANGVVTDAGWSDGGYGYLIVIEHEYDYTTYYAHNSKLRVSVGDEVVRGQVIALSGNSGRSTSPHCHYEVRLDGLPQDPWGYMN